DVRLWLDSPPRSSYPACMAVKAAAEQGPAVAGRFLRVLREGFACRRLRLDRSEALLDQARGQDSLDLQRFTVGLGSHAIVEAFGADLEQARAGDSDGERITLPSIDFEGEGGERHEAHGSSSYGDYRDAVIACGAVPGGSPAPDVEQALAHFESMATAEVAEVCRLPGPRAAAELWRLASEWRVRSEAVGSGELWSLA
ncbi:MAG TPA: DsbA family protein, partial [Solirubrobacteraceae bacterium]|nr:DsbA family protein [Solirubrobacteraceae bacterium]